MHIQYIIQASFHYLNKLQASFSISEEETDPQQQSSSTKITPVTSPTSNAANRRSSNDIDSLKKFHQSFNVRKYSFMKMLSIYHTLVYIWFDKIYVSQLAYKKNEQECCTQNGESIAVNRKGMYCLHTYMYTMY